MLSASALSDSVGHFGSEEFALWNKVITKDFFESMVGDGMFSATLEDGKAIYVFVYKPPASDPNYILSAAVEVRSAGTLLGRANMNAHWLQHP